MKKPDTIYIVGLGGSFRLGCCTRTAVEVALQVARSAIPHRSQQAMAFLRERETAHSNLGGGRPPVR